MVDLSVTPHQQLPSQVIKHLHTQKWYAWVPLRITGPRRIHVHGEVEARNAGIRTLLIKKRAACSHDLLCLELVLSQQPGQWPAIDCWMPAKYEEIMFGTFYSMVHLFMNQKLIEKFPVDIIQRV